MNELCTARKQGVYLRYVLNFVALLTWYAAIYYNENMKTVSTACKGKGRDFLPEEYETIYRTYYKRIYLFVYKLCQNADTAEDLTQETFYQAYLSMHRFRGESDIFTFLASIAKHTYFKYLRKNKHALNCISLSDIAEYIRDDELCDPEYIYERSAERADVRKALDKIPKKYRDVMIYRIFADMSYAQVADALGITENSAKVIFFRGKKLLLEELKNGNYV